VLTCHGLTHGLSQIQPVTKKFHHPYALYRESIELFGIYIDFLIHTDTVTVYFMF